MLKPVVIMVVLVAILFILPFNTFDTISLIEEEIEIFVKGEVKKEQFIVLKPRSTIKDLLEIVPLTNNADVSRLDVNNFLIDKQVVTIPKKDELKCVSINSDTEEGLTTLPGIGPSTAQKIVAYRTLNGPFLYLEDLMNVKGIGIRKYETIKTLICL